MKVDSQAMDSRKLLEELVALPGPPGQEEGVRNALISHVSSLGMEWTVDPKGNLIVPIGGSTKPKVVVTAHMDEIAMIVKQVHADGSLSVGSLGGLFPWKIGEGPVSVLASGEQINGVLSFGSIHTNDPASAVRRAEESGLKWEMTRVLTGLTEQEICDLGVRPGTRVVVHPSRRTVFEFGNSDRPLLGSYFMDDRADLVAWLLALKSLFDSGLDATFVATTSEEVGGEGALYYLLETRPDVCIALELGPRVADAPVELSSQPTVWATDSYGLMSATDGDLVARVAKDLGIDAQFQALSRGGSDASCAASRGFCARPITLGIPMENSHGFEIIHPESMAKLAKLTVGLVIELFNTLAARATVLHTD